MSDPLNEIQRIAAELKRAAPRTYDDFVDAFRVCEDAAINDLLAATSDTILVTQGRARAIRHLRQKLEKTLKG